MYKFYFKYSGENGEELMKFPLAPERLVTRVRGHNKEYETLGAGEINLIKDIGLRILEFTVFLPKEASFADGFTQEEQAGYAPINYLAKLREIMAGKCRIALIVERTLPDGEKIFNGNMPVTLENYTIRENAGEEGSFWADIKIKEYRDIYPIVYEPTGDKSQSGAVNLTETGQRQNKQTAKSYTVKKGDSLWKIAKLELNDGSRYKEIAELNGIADPNLISVGTVLILP